jgi:hypothetical protein
MSPSGAGASDGLAPVSVKPLARTRPSVPRHSLPKNLAGVLKSDGPIFHFFGQMHPTGGKA